MGNTIASFYECFDVDTGKFDLLKYAVYCCIQLKKCNKERDQLHKLITKHHHEDDRKSTGKKTCAAKKKMRRWMRSDCTGTELLPIELLLIGSLCYLGRGLTFDDIEEFIAIHKETHGQFFHKCIEFGRKAGFHGAEWSSGATHAHMDMCYYGFRNAHKGLKLSYPLHTCNISVNHQHRKLSSTLGHPARWNDKMIVLFNNFMTGVYE
eukprot:2843573-Ditylum_brightwellii.AAC.1